MTEHLANERTFLAWIRTSIAIVSLGFVVAKFNLWVRQLSGRATEAADHSSHPHSSLLIGIVMMAMGGLFALLAARRYHDVTQAIERGQVQPNRGLITFVAAIVVLLSFTMIACILFSVDGL